MTDEEHATWIKEAHRNMSISLEATLTLTGKYEDAVRAAEKHGLTVDHGVGDYQPRVQCYAEPKITRLVQF